MLTPNGRTVAISVEALIILRDCLKAKGSKHILSEEEYEALEEARRVLRRHWASENDE